ncbi:MAG: transcription/translation regulatory transformer protein RfaH [Candidatus Accumulibacter sp.]|jgi:transcriptional antiterminator RfaH|nr:transcription/translation regulatory transformer protein RfaH [Accumulibacter sp.]
MKWYLVHTKPRQEHVALINLERQGYACYLPLVPEEKLRRRKLSIVNEPLFPRYLFIHLDHGENAKDWGPIRSTRGVSRLVAFGNEPACIDENLIGLLRARERFAQGAPAPLFSPDERLRLVDGAFAGIDAVYQMTDAEGRAMVLIELLSKSVQMTVPLTCLRKIA